MTRDAHRAGRLVVLLLTTVFSPAFAGENTWTTTGPAGASVMDIAIHPTNNQIMYIATVQKGIYKTTDGGANWLHLEANGVFSTMRRVALHPLAPDTVYATSAEGVFKSPDAGLTWSNVTPPGRYPNEFRGLLVHPTEPSLIITGGPMVDAWVSKNGGQTWIQMTYTDYPCIEDVVVDPTNPNVLYLGSGGLQYGLALWKSEDRGVSWSNIHNNLDLEDVYVTDIEVDPIDSRNVYLALDSYFNSSGHALAKSTDGGNSWTYITPPQLTHPTVYGIVVSPLDHKIVFACTANEGVLKSPDGGMTWQSANNGLRTPVMRTVKFDTSSGVAYLATYLDGIYKSTDSGESWLNISQSVYALSCGELAFNPLDPITICSSTSLGLFRLDRETPDEWQFISVTRRRSRITTVSWDPFRPENLYAADTRFSVMFGGGSEFVRFYATTDSGHSWRSCAVGRPQTLISQLGVAYFGEDARILFLASSIGLFRSSNNGETWEVCDRGLPPDVEFYEIAVASSDPTILAVGDRRGDVYISSDTGLTWLATTPLPDVPHAYIADLEFHPSDPSHVVVSAANLGLFESLDLGTSWTDITNDLPVYQPYIIIDGITINPLNSTNVFVSSNFYGVFQTHDGGQHWESFNAGLDTANAIGKMSFVPGDTTQLFLASVRGSVWSITRTLTGIEEEAPVVPRALTAANYPNPFNSSTNIAFTLPQAGPVTLTVYDALGRKVLAPINGVLAAGSHKIGIALPRTSSGIYFYKLQTEKEDITGKMLLLK